MADIGWDSPWGELVETRMRVVTWNLWWRFGPWEARQPAITETLRRLDADIVCLQEVWGLPGQTNLAEVLAADLGGYHHAYAQRLEMTEGVTFGNAVLSRWPITRTEHRPLPAPERWEEYRTVLFCEVGGPRGPVQVFCTHLNWRFDHSHVRQEQVRAICDFIADTRPRDYPPVLCGDFNADPDSDEMRMLTGKSASPVEGLVFHDAWLFGGDGGPGITWSNDNPYAALDLERDRRIDYVLAGWPKRGGAGHVVHAEVIGTAPVDGIVGSDHYGLLAELRY